MVLTAVLTGASGFVGQRALKQLCQGWDVHAVSRVPPVDGANQAVHWIPQDLSQTLNVEMLPRRIDAVVHLAQSGYHRDFPQQALDVFRVNVASTMDLLDYARRAGARVFVYASSGGICGFRPGSIRESDPAAPSSFYLRSKYISEQLVAGYSEYFSTICLRYFFPYGERQKMMMMPNLIAGIASGKAVTLAGRDGIRLNPTYVEDVAMATVRSLELQGQHVLNVAGPEITTFRKLAIRIGQVVGREPVFQLGPPGPGDLIGDTEEIAARLGWRPATDLAEGLTRTIRDFMSAASAEP